MLVDFRSGGIALEFEFGSVRFCARAVGVGKELGYHPEFGASGGELAIQ